MARASATAGKVSLRSLLGWVFLWGFGVGLLGVALLVVLVGLPYWLTPTGLRPDHSLHPWFGSGSIVGLLVGIVGTGLMTVLLLYSVRKWIPFLEFMGTSQFWMRFHMLCGLLGPLFILVHGGLKLPSGFIGIGFWCMVLVAVSGFFGRYLFGYFPATAAGLRLDLEAEQRRLADLRARLVAETQDAGVSEQVGTAMRLARDVYFEPRSLGELVVLDADVRRRADLIRIMLHRAGLPSDARVRAERTLLQQLATRRNMAGFEVARKFLRYWNLFHQPLALAMYLIVIVHILNAFLFGGVIPTLLGGF